MFKIKIKTLMNNGERNKINSNYLKDKNIMLLKRNLYKNFKKISKATDFMKFIKAVDNFKML